MEQWKREVPRSEKGLPAVLAKAKAGIRAMLERPSVVWSGSRIKTMYRQRIEACESILTVMVERTQLGLAGGTFEFFHGMDGKTTYRPLAMIDLLRETGLTKGSFYRAWNELERLGFVRAELQKKKFVAPGEYRVTDVLRSLTLKFWKVVGVGAEAFKRACQEISEKAKKLLQTGKNAVIRISRRVYSTKAQAKAAVEQKKLSDARNELGRDAARCWAAKKAQGENILECYGCAKVCSEWCQKCLNEERANLAAGHMSYQEQGFMMRQQKQEEFEMKLRGLQINALRHV